MGVLLLDGAIPPSPLNPVACILSGLKKKKKVGAFEMGLKRFIQQFQQLEDLKASTEQELYGCFSIQLGMLGKKKVKVCAVYFLSNNAINRQNSRQNLD